MDLFSTQQVTPKKSAFKLSSREERLRKFKEIYRRYGINFSFQKIGKFVKVGIWERGRFKGLARKSFDSDNEAEQFLFDFYKV